MKTAAPRIRFGALVILTALGALQCQNKGVLGSAVVLPGIVHVTCGDGCDTAATFDLRAFIPSQLPGATPPGGPWPEPSQPVPLANIAQMTNEADCEFYGDNRSFSSSPAASSRLHNIVNMPALPPDACDPHKPVTFDPHCDVSHRRCLQNGVWVQQEPKTAERHVSTSSVTCSLDGARLYVIENVNAGYPYVAAAAYFGPIVELLTIISFTTDDGGGQVTQHYQLTMNHTTFPDHELVATVCGQTVSLYQFTTGYSGPSTSDLGLQSPLVESQVEFDVVQQIGTCGSESTTPTECDSSACTGKEGGDVSDGGQRDARNDDATRGDDGESAGDDAVGEEEDGGASGDAAPAQCTSFATPGCVDFHGEIESGGDGRNTAAGSLSIDLGSSGYCLQSPCEFDDCYVCPHLDTAFPQGATVTATATPSAGSVFAQWGQGACAGQGPTCTFVAEKPSCITAQFLLQNSTAPPQSLPDASCPEDPTAP